MKSVFIVFNQANTERVEYMLDMLGIRGFTFFEQVQGRGTNGGEPRRGTHTWPEMNSAVITVVEDDKVEELLTTVKKLDLRNKEVGVRAFVFFSYFCISMKKRNLILDSSYTGTYSGVAVCFYIYSPL